MTIKILRLVNSAYFGLPQKIVSIKHGIVYVGINTIKNLALGIASVGGLFVSGVLTIVVVPILYDLFTRKEKDTLS